MGCCCWPHWPHTYVRHSLDRLITPLERRQYVNTARQGISDCVQVEGSLGEEYSARHAHFSRHASAYPNDEKWRCTMRLSSAEETDSRKNFQRLFPSAVLCEKNQNPRWDCISFSHYLMCNSTEFCVRYTRHNVLYGK